jgi:glycosyltransferase involved in cell wall biosynthesis
MFLRLFNRNVKEPKLLIVGHDLKFLSPVIDHLIGKNEFKIEKFCYAGHIIPNKKNLLKILPEFKIIFCEWGLENISFLSKNKRSGQKLLVRIHLQEFSTNFLKETNWENVDAMIFISQYQLDRFKLLFPEFAGKCSLIFNVIDCNSFDRKKDQDARFNLGLMGILPRRKAPHLGLEILHELKKFDSRYRLSIKSKRPEELDWLWKKPEEREYFDRFYSMIESLNLNDSVVFEQHGDDVPDWFKKIGFILSPSEFEGSHQSVAEGMAAGSIPVIRNWDGSVPLYPAKYNFTDIKTAIDIILGFSNDADFQRESQAVKQYAQANFDLSVILPQYDQLIDSLINHRNME